jgi:hypothetical protein
VKIKTKNITFTHVGNDFCAFQPAPAIKHLPEWYKNQNSYTHNTRKKYGSNGGEISIKKCMPVADALSAGYLIFLQTDVYVDQDDKSNPMYRWQNDIVERNIVEFHPPAQADKHPLHDTKYAFPKWINHWTIKTPKGYSILVKSPAHSDQQLFTTFEGIVDTDTFNNNINFPFVMKDKTWEGLIPAGTPIAQIIPFKRENWEMQIGGEKEVAKSLNDFALIKTKMFNSYKTQFWSRKEYK